MHSHPRRRRAIGALVGTTLLVTSLGAGAALAGGQTARQRAFVHVGTFDVRLNGSSVAEIVDATKDGTTLIYTDSAEGEIGFVDISDPASPAPAGTVAVGGEPTSVGITSKYALVAIDTSNGDFDRPTGELLVLDLASRTVVKSLPLGGQPDSVAISPDQRYAAIVIENQRDEDENDGLIPQLPAGRLVVVDLRGSPDWWPLRYVDFTGLAMADASDPEPEFVDINERNQAVVTLQENNHLAVVNLRNGRIIGDFPAGTADVVNIDATEDELGPQGNGIISLTESITDRRREPDTVGWLTSNTFAIANEGDYEDANGVEGGSRGFTVFRTDGTIVYESAESFEHAQISAGHYNEGRSENKGGEPEALEVGTFRGTRMLFVGAERANVIGVYDASGRTPELLQLLPTGIGPEGLKAIPKRNLLVAAAETSVDDLIPSMITIYRYGRTSSPSMTLVSGPEGVGTPIPWVAMSGLVGDPVAPDVIYGVTDSFLAEAGIYTIDASTTPAVITSRVRVSAPDGTLRNDLDVEGVAVAPEGGFWLASEGRTNAGSERVNALLRVDAAGVVQEEVGLPAELLAAGLTSSGFEGVAVVGEGTTEHVYAVIQREWASDAAGFVKVARYTPSSGEWAFVSYPLDALALPAGGWVGLSELTLLPDGTFAVIERDNQIGPAAISKRVYGVDLAAADFQPFVAGTPLPVVSKTLLADVLDELAANSVWTPDKLEGLAVTADGEVVIVTDNDGLDDAIGQTVFLNLGPIAQAFPRS